MRNVLKLLSVVIVTAGAGPALALEGDPVAGEAVFKKCATCHVVAEPTNKVGPTLNKVLGRQPGTFADFKYSKAMIEFGEGKTWTDELLTTYLADPKKLVKGTKMAFAGLKKEQEVADVIAYLKSAGAAQ